MIVLNDPSIIYDTNMLDFTMPPVERFCITNVSVFELVKGKNILEKEKQYKKIYNYIAKYHCLYLVHKGNNGEFIKYDNFKIISENECRDVSRRIYEIFIDISYCIGEIIISYNYKNVIDEYPYSLRKQMLFLKAKNQSSKIGDDIFYNYSKDKVEKEYNLIGVSLVNDMIDLFNQHFKKYRSINHIKRLSYEEIYKAVRNKDEILENITKSLLNIERDTNGELTIETEKRLLEGMLKNGFSFEYNDISDFYIVFCARKTNKLIKTNDKKIKRVFPDLVY